MNVSERDLKLLSVFLDALRDRFESAVRTELTEEIVDNGRHSWDYAAILVCEKDVVNLTDEKVREFLENLALTINVDVA